MSTVGAILTALIIGAIVIAAVETLHESLQRRRAPRPDRCLCGRWNLAQIHAQHDGATVHERQRCFPKREFISALEAS